MQKPTIPKGTRDFGPKEAIKRNYIISIIRKNFERYGFLPIETPTLENLSVLTGKYGDEGDQLIFKILNSGDFLKKSTIEDYNKGSSDLLNVISEKGLRYDLTVPFARFVAMNQNEITFPFRRYQIQPVWRADRPQKGRYREFYQCDADIIGSGSETNEIELTLLIHDVFKDLGITEFELLVNHRDVLFSLADLIGLKGKEIPFCVIIDKLDKIGKEKVHEELIGLGSNDETNNLLDMLTQAGSNDEKLPALLSIIGDNPGLRMMGDYLSRLQQLDNRKLNHKFDLSLARGLSYYTGMIFEVKVTNLEMGSILGGGRYDNLTGIFGLPDVSGVGISFGLDRIYDVMSALNLFPDTHASTTQVLICHLDDQSKGHSLMILDKLRLSGISSELYPDQVKLKKQLNYANKLAIPYVIIIGADEIKQGIYALKNMRTGDQESFRLDKLVTELKKSH